MIISLVYALLQVMTESGQLANFLLMNAVVKSGVWSWNFFLVGMIAVNLSRGMLWKFAFDSAVKARQSGSAEINGLIILIALVLFEVVSQAFLSVNSQGRLIYSPDPDLNNRLYAFLLGVAVISILLAALVKMFNIRI